MAIPIYLWLEDDAGRSIKGSVDIKHPQNAYNTHQEYLKDVLSRS